MSEHQSRYAATHYRELGLAPVVNAAATLTRLGGSRLAPPVLAAMADAANHFVDLPEPQRRVGDRIAALTGNEAGYVSSGAAAGIVLAVAACMVGPDSGWTRDGLVDALWNRDPCIAVAVVGDEIALNPQALDPGEDVLVLDALRELLGVARPVTPTST